MRSMKLNLILGCVAVATLIVVSSCSEDNPPPKAGITFEITELEVFESDGTISSFHPLIGSQFPGAPTTTGREVLIKVVSDKPLSENAVIGITFAGTANKNSTSNPIGDYDVVGSSENIIIEKGETSAFIKLTLFEDYGFEATSTIDYETVIITLNDVISGPAIIGDDDEFTLTINEDDALVLLDWTDKNLNVDMDLFLWIGDEIWDISLNEGTESEGVLIPAGLPNETYGMSYTYWGGESDNLEFTVDIINFGGTLNGLPDPLSFTGVYTSENINEWSDDTSPNYKGDPQIVQTMVKNGMNYSNISNITVPLDGSRIKKTSEVISKGQRGKYQNRFSN